VIPVFLASVFSARGDFKQHDQIWGVLSMSAVETKTALIALQGMRSASADMAKATERLATGKRINQAADDPAGNAQAVRLKADISSFDIVKRGLAKTDSELGQLNDSLNAISGFLVEMRSLALLAASETDTDAKGVYKESFDQFVNNIRDALASAKIGGKSVFDQTTANETTASVVSVQSGITATDTKSLSFTGLATTGGALATVASVNLASGTFTAAATAIDAAIVTVSKELSKVGGYQNSIQFASDYVDSTILNKSVQLSQVVDADFAQEATNLAAARIRQDASTAVLAQANSMTRTVADFLLKGAMG
jgi:flagellin